MEKTRKVKASGIVSYNINDRKNGKRQFLEATALEKSDLYFSDRGDPNDTTRPSKKAHNHDQ